MFRYTDGITEATDTDENMSGGRKDALQSDDPTEKMPSVRINRIIRYKG